MIKSPTKNESTLNAGISALLFGLILLVVMSLFSRFTYAQDVAEGKPAAANKSPEELNELVGRIALYPDELIGIVLPASTYPLQIVQASRFLEKQKTDSALKPDEAWDASVLGLLNYPEVIGQMNDDLDWTWALGEAVVNQQQDVMNAIQAFREKTDEAGNLESNTNVVVIKETEVIKIESASPEVIYVPTYNPDTVVVYSSTPYPYYYSPPYPYYYSPAAVFWTGMFVGAAIGYGVHWHGGYHGGDIDINHYTNININSNNINRNTINEINRNNPGGNNWNSNRTATTQGGRPGLASSTSAGISQQSRQASAVAANSGASAVANRSASSASNRPASASGSRFGDSPAGVQTSAQTQNRQQGSAGSFDSYERGASANRSSQRGSSSRAAMSSSSRGTAGARSGGGGRSR